MTEVYFYESSHDPGTVLTYSVIASRFREKWVFVRHHLRSTFEIAGGHIETGETPDEAACRELMEETGAIEFTLEPVATYSVMKDGETGWGRLYFAEIGDIGPVPDISEIAEVVFLDTLPQNPTHPDIQPHLFRRITEFIGSRNGNP
ncbi:MAG: NUDIX domain-containing protein [Bacteroidales bacterium]|jgi:8-oxo-dGTP diphosphatase|nr:NUDIX domain-containing protein [Bacteroidales bacterium]